MSVNLHSENFVLRDHLEEEACIICVEVKSCFSHTLYLSLEELSL
jgi:hypothetical protein